MDRRGILKGLAGGIGLAFAHQTVVQAECLNVITPPQTEGPFYPRNRPKDLDVDLVRTKENAPEAEGVRVLIEGVVMNQFCERVDGVLVDLWQACHSGRYNHPNDPNRSAPLDPHFQYAAEVLTDEFGKFRVRTIIPGAYPADKNWIRPPHIHLKVTKRGFKELTTQVYFDLFRDLNEKDLILGQLSKEERDSVIMRTIDARDEETDLGPVEMKAFLNLTIVDLRG